MYIVLLTTRGPPSCPCGMPVVHRGVNVQIFHIARIDLRQRTEAGVGVIAGGHLPVAIGLGADQANPAAMPGTVVALWACTVRVLFMPP